MARIKEVVPVVFPFRDLEDTNKTNPKGREYAVGDLYPAVYLDVTEERLKELGSTKNKIGKVLIDLSDYDFEDEVGEE